VTCHPDRTVDPGPPRLYTLVCRDGGQRRHRIERSEAAAQAALDLLDNPGQHCSPHTITTTLAAS
jgi:hypothetical protein